MLKRIFKSRNTRQCLQATNGEDVARAEELCSVGEVETGIASRMEIAGESQGPPSLPARKSFPRAQV